MGPTRRCSWRATPPGRGGRCPPSTGTTRCSSPPRPTRPGSRPPAARGGSGRPAGITDVRGWLREIFANHATPARLADIVRAAELPADLVRGRQLAVLARGADGDAAGRLASALLDQRLRPTEVIAGVPSGSPSAAAVREALGKLTDHD